MYSFEEQADVTLIYREYQQIYCEWKIYTLNNILIALSFQTFKNVCDKSMVKCL